MGYKYTSLGKCVKPQYKIMFLIENPCDPLILQRKQKKSKEPNNKTSKISMYSLKELVQAYTMKNRGYEAHCF